MLFFQNFHFYNAQVVVSKCATVRVMAYTIIFLSLGTQKLHEWCVENGWNSKGEKWQKNAIFSILFFNPIARIDRTGTLSKSKIVLD